jgi:hypothetical protein
MTSPSLQARRDYRVLLGYCRHCTQPAAPGAKCCARHLALDVAYTRKRRDRLAQARGWKFVKVKT